MSLLPWRRKGQTDHDSKHQNQGGFGGDDNHDPRYIGPPIHQGAPFGNRVPPANINDHTTVLGGFPPGQTTSQEHRQDSEHASEVGLEHRHQFDEQPLPAIQHQPEDHEEIHQGHPGPTYLGPPITQGGGGPAYLGPPVHVGDGNDSDEHPKIHSMANGFAETHSGLPEPNHSGSAAAQLPKEDSRTSWKEGHNTGGSQQGGTENGDIVAGVMYGQNDSGHQMNLGGESIVVSGGNPLEHKDDILKPWNEHESPEIAAGFNPSQQNSHQN